MRQASWLGKLASWHVHTLMSHRRVSRSSEQRNEPRLGSVEKTSALTISNEPTLTSPGVSSCTRTYRSCPWMSGAT